MARLICCSLFRFPEDTCSKEDRDEQVEDCSPPLEIQLTMDQGDKRFFSAQYFSLIPVVIILTRGWGRDRCSSWVSSVADTDLGIFRRQIGSPQSAAG